MLDRPIQTGDRIQAACAPFIVAVIQKVGCPDQLQVKAFMILILIAQRIIFQSRIQGRLAERSGLILSNGEEQSRADGEFGSDVIDQVAACAGNITCQRRIALEPARR